MKQLKSQAKMHEAIVFMIMEQRIVTPEIQEADGMNPTGAPANTWKKYPGYSTERGHQAEPGGLHELKRCSSGSRWLEPTGQRARDERDSEREHGRSAVTEFSVDYLSVDVWEETTQGREKSHRKGLKK